MIANVLDSRLKLQKLILVFGLGVMSLLLGYALAENAYMTAILTAGVGWLVTLPYHSTLSSHVAVATFGSAFILPFVPGRPFFWEFAALLGWSGLVITISLRRYRPDAGEVLRTNRWLFVGLIAYCVVLLVTMYYRGFGFRVLGSDQMGGRNYFQQLICSVFPILFALCAHSERTLLRLYVLQCLLTATYLVSDFVFSIAPRQLFILLQFFELPNDAVNFESQIERFGIRRFQSLYVVSLGFLCLLLVWRNLAAFFSSRALYLMPLSAVLVGLGVLSGHRYTWLISSIMLAFVAYTQRFFNFRNAVLVSTVGLISLSSLYLLARELPLAAQRVATVLPGINVDPQAREDARGTLEMRRILRKIALDMAPQYLWVGRGFSQSGAGDYSMQWDPTSVTLHVNIGKFYNGFAGLLVNTGLFGLLSMLLFVSAGTAVAWRMMQHIRTHGCEDPFARMCSIVASLWCANVIAFFFFHGDSEWAMKTFSLQAGLLLACHHSLKLRLQEPAGQPA